MNITGVLQFYYNRVRKTKKDGKPYGRRQFEGEFVNTNSVYLNEAT